MSRTPRERCERNVYHVLIRGVEKQPIFEDAQDRKRFVEILVDQLGNYQAQLWAWCLMDNHVHLLLHIPYDSLAPFMQRLQTNYARFFNRRHERTGTLFQGRFHSVAMNSDDELAAAVRYIHYKPVKVGGKLSGPWSSYREYLGEEGPANTDLPLKILGGPKGFANLHEAGHDAGVVLLPRTRIKDEDSVALAQAALGKTRIHDVKSLDKTQRNEKLRTLKEAGLSVRQISMLTGIGHNIVTRA